MKAKTPPLAPKSSGTALTICITSWNSLPTLKTTLEQIKSEFDTLAFVYEVFVFDQGSIDKTPDWLRANEKSGFYDRIWLSQINLGQCVSRNKMCETAQGDFIMFLDGDVVPIPQSIAMMFEYLMGHPGCNGVHYDIKGDTAFPERATPAEVPITDMDISVVNLLPAACAACRGS